MSALSHNSVISEAEVNQPALFKGIFPSIRQVKDKMPEKPFTTQQLALAEQVLRRSFLGYCPHDPKCGVWTDCRLEIAREMRRKGYL